MKLIYEGAELINLMLFKKYRIFFKLKKQGSHDWLSFQSVLLDSFFAVIGE
jgi:hypothetical protein